MKPKDLKAPFKWNGRRTVFEEGVLHVPRYFDQHDRSLLPAFDAKVAVEFCSGNGDWVVNKAQMEPDKMWIAVEMQFDRVRKIWSKKHNADVHNLLIVCGRAEDFLEHYVPDGALSEVYIHYPDPWPKDRHAKHRLMQMGFVRSLARKIIDGGQLDFVTDDLPYLTETRSVLEESQLWGPCCEKSHHGGYGNSYFSQLWESMGRAQHRLSTSYQKQRWIDIDLSANSALDWQESGSADYFHLHIEWDKVIGGLEETSLNYALRHFLDMLDRTPVKGVILYQGKPRLEWLEAMERVAAFFPDELIPFVLLDLSEIDDPLDQARIVERMPHFCVAVRDSVAPISSYKWDDQGIYCQPLIAIKEALCLPLETNMKPVRKVLERFIKARKKAVRIIPELYLTENWEGLDRIFYRADALSVEGKRKLQGFCAALGEIAEIE